MSEKPRSSDVRPKSGFRSWSADSYVWPRKKRSRKVSSPAGLDLDSDLTLRSTSCPRRKCSCADPSGADLDSVCRKTLTRRSLRQKFQDAVGQCLPLKSDRTHQRFYKSSSKQLSVLFWSKRKVHVSELMQDKCPFSPKSELARCWHLIKNQNHKPLQSTAQTNNGPNTDQNHTDQINGETRGGRLN